MHIIVIKNAPEYNLEKGMRAELLPYQALNLIKLGIIKEIEDEDHPKVKTKEQKFSK